MTGEPEDDRDTALALARLFGVPAILVGNRLLDADETEPWFMPLLGVAWVYAVAMLVAARRIPAARRRRSAPWAAATDVLLLVALVAGSGGPYSGLRAALFVTPLTAALVARPASVATVGAGTIAAWVLVGLLHPLSDERGDAVEVEVAESVYLAWATVVAVLLSAVLERRERALSDLAASRRRLVAESLETEQRERMKIADALHDNAVQTLSAARTELGAGEGADLEFVRHGLDLAVTQLRSALTELHPHVLRHSGLAAALRALATGPSSRGLEVTVTVDDDATGPHDALIHSVARELLLNVERHAAARHVTVEVRREADAVVLVVTDDGIGIDVNELAHLPLRGHIGLASCAERVAVHGGTFRVERHPDGGTVAVARL